MHQKIFYQLSVSYPLEFISLKKSEPVKSYFSNLKLTMKRLDESLEINQWPKKGINYTAAYRKIKLSGKAVFQIRVKGSALLRIEIEALKINPPIPYLGIDSFPYV